MKMKSTAIGGVEKEQKRLYQDASKYKNDVNPSQSHFNVYINRDESWRKQLKPFLEKHRETTGRKIRKDAVVMCSTIQSVPSSWPKEKCNQYFEKYDDFLIEFLTSHGVDENCFVSSATHHDESSPHHTVVWMPFKDGKFQAKNILTRQCLRELQKETYNFYLGFAKKNPDLEMMEMYELGNDVSHLNEKAYKISRLQSEIDSKEKELERIRNEIGSQNTEKEAQSSKIKNLIQKLKETFNSLWELLNLLRLITRFADYFRKTCDEIAKDFYGELDQEDYAAFDVIDKIADDPEHSNVLARAILKGEELDRQ